MFFVFVPYSDIMGMLATGTTHTAPLSWKSFIFLNPAHAGKFLQTLKFPRVSTHVRSSYITQNDFDSCPLNPKP